MDCPKKICNGELIKVRKFYVCDTCCADTVTFDEVLRIAASGKNVHMGKPKGKSIEITNPEFIGFYPYKINGKTKWRKSITLLGKDGTPYGALVIADYSKCKFITSSEPKYMAHMPAKGYVQTVTLQEDDVIFHT